MLNNTISSLAYAELYLTISSFARGFDMELYESGSENIRVFRDQGLPYPEKGHWKIKAKVTRVIEN
jgi:hypothetical protein